MWDSTTRFSNRVDNYIKYRPHYPSQVIETLQADCDLAPAAVIADMGSGTGFLAELFLKNGNRVYGVEPNREMRAAAETALVHYPNFISITATAEATTLPDAGVNFITAGQAFHWFDRAACKREFQRILRPNGWVVILWNDRLTDTTPFLAGYERLLHKYATDYEKIDHRRITYDVLTDFFSPCAFVFRSFPNNQVLDFDSAKGRLLSSSYIPLEGPAHNAMLTELKLLFDGQAQNGTVTFEYITQMYYGHLVR